MGPHVSDREQGSSMMETVPDLRRASREITFPQRSGLRQNQKPLSKLISVIHISVPITELEIKLTCQNQSQKISLNQKQKNYNLVILPLTKQSVFFPIQSCPDFPTPFSDSSQTSSYIKSTQVWSPTQSTLNHCYNLPSLHRTLPTALLTVSLYKLLHDHQQNGLG